MEEGGGGSRRGRGVEEGGGGSRRGRGVEEGGGGGGMERQKDELVAVHTKATFLFFFNFFFFTIGLKRQSH